MVDYDKIRELINSEEVSIEFKGNRINVKDSVGFKGVSFGVMNEINDMIANGIHSDMQWLASRGGNPVMTYKDCEKRAQDNAMKLLGVVREKRDGGIRDSIMNVPLNIGNGADNGQKNIVLPNIYLSPYEANSLYSQKGIFETVINKKAKTINLNGVTFINPKLSEEERERINLRMEELNVQGLISDVTRDSLVYGGAIFFPMLKKDTPLSFGMDLNELLRAGILGEGCIDYFVSLDRWNTLIVPCTNPTQIDFVYPKYYTIPFLGASVHRGRVARVVTAKQAGYWGQIINQGWGISDFCGYLQSGLNYKATINALPIMIQQMSILARVVNIDGVLATEGTNVLDALSSADTLRMREASANNPINLDVLGEIKSINRDFQQVPEMIKLLRQDFASDATIPEPMLFSSEKGNFSSGDDTEGNQSKQWEVVKMLHKEISREFDNIAKIIMIDVLGTSKEVLDKLQYCMIKFDEPLIANSLEKAQIGKLVSENIFNLVAAQIPIDTSIEIANRSMAIDLCIGHEILDKVRAQQDKQRQLTQEKQQLEIEQLRIQNENLRLQGQMGDTGNTGETSVSKKKSQNESDDEDKKYSKLEQRQHEQTRSDGSKRNESLSKQQNKLENTQNSNQTAEKTNKRMKGGGNV